MNKSIIGSGLPGLGKSVMSVLLNWKKIGIILSLIFIALYPVIQGDTYVMHIFILFFLICINNLDNSYNLESYI